MDKSSACSLDDIPEEFDPDLASFARSKDHGPRGPVPLKQQRMLAGPWRSAAEEGMGLPDTPVATPPARPRLAEEDIAYAAALEDPRMVRVWLALDYNLV